MGAEIAGRRGGEASAGSSGMLGAWDWTASAGVSWSGMMGVMATMSDVITGEGRCSSMRMIDHVTRRPTMISTAWSPIDTVHGPTRSISRCMRPVGELVTRSDTMPRRIRLEQVMPRH